MRRQDIEFVGKWLSDGNYAVLTIPSIAVTAFIAAFHHVLQSETQQVEIMRNASQTFALQTNNIRSIL